MAVLNRQIQEKQATPSTNVNNYQTAKSDQKTFTNDTRNFDIFVFGFGTWIIDKIPINQNYFMP